MERFGDYFIQQKVAVGGMAEIYKAEDQLGHLVAIKKILPELATEQKFVQMFLDEVRIVIQLHHANIVQLLDFGLVDSSYYFSMEWVDGKSLADVIMQQRRLNMSMPPEVCVLMGIDVCEGLHYAHEKKDRYERPLNIIHRDLSPPNLMVNREGIFKIADFGIAQVRDKNIKTQPGIIRGKFSYMSPEQSLGKGLDARSDLFSIGIVLYESLTSSRLFLRKNEGDTLDAVRKCQIPPLKEFRGDIPAKLEQVIRKSLSASAAQRYMTAGEFAQALRQVKESCFPEVGRWAVTEYLQKLFPDEVFTATEKKPAHLRGKTTEAMTPIKTAVSWVNEHRFSITAAIGFCSLILAEFLIRRG